MANEKLKAALDPLLKDLEAQKAAILAESAPLHARRQALLEKIQPLEAELRKVDAEITKIEQPRILEVGREIAQVHRAMGAITLRTE